MTDANIVTLILACGTALFIDILLIVDSLSTFINNVIEIKKIHNIMIAGIIQAIAYAVEFVFHRYDYFGFRSLGLFAESLLFIGNMIFILAFADFICSKYEKKLYNININRIAFLIPAIMLIFLEVVNMFFPVFFDIKFNITADKLVYTEKPLTILINVLPVLYILFAGINDIKEAHKNSKYNFLPISLYFIPSVVGIVIESLYDDLPIVPIGCSISMMVLYLCMLKKIAYIDALSGLYTRSQIQTYFNSLRTGLSRTESIAGIMLDVNKFKHINDTYGHVTGDRAIVAVADILKRATAKKGLCFRYGGDEFIVLLKISHEKEIEELMDKIDKTANEFNAKKTEVFDISLSKGSAVYDTDSDTVVTFVEKMDTKMYENKRALR